MSVGVEAILHLACIDVVEAGPLLSYEKEINCFSVRDSGQNKGWNCSLPIDCQDNLRYSSPTPTPSLARETQHPYSEAGSAHASAFS